jgi:NAD(P)H-hydrate epimerase
MHSLEEQANKSGLSYERMMHNAGIGLADMVADRYCTLPKKRVLGLIGSGNNGGDTLVALTRLIKLGWKAKAYVVKGRPAADKLLKSFQKEGGEVFTEKDDSGLVKLRKLINEDDLLLDGVLGTGTKLPLKGKIAKVLGAISKMKSLPHIVAVDCPSGLDCDSGEVWL